MSYYPIEIVQPRKNELLSAGFLEFETIEKLDELISNVDSIFVVVNSVCGCAARLARPAAVHAIENSTKKPLAKYTVFAGYDLEQTQRLREYCLPYPASSPSMALFVKGKLVYFMERHQIEGRDALAISNDLQKAFEQHLV